MVGIEMRDSMLRVDEEAAVFLGIGILGDLPRWLAMIE